ncbi:MAG: hypothetical protein LJU34_04260 [Oscillospiraceae bacterium]|nr:hypothetical protein [Oscillospiraceae bacterium]
MVELTALTTADGKAAEKETASGGADADAAGGSACLSRNRRPTVTAAST